MKKTKVLSVFLLAVALIFASCDNASNSSSGGGSDSGSGGSNSRYSDFPEMDVSEFSDCTADASSLEIQNGTNWSVRFMQYDDSYSRSVDDAPPFTLEMNITTTYSNNDFTFTSGKFTQTMKTRDCMDEEDYQEYLNYSENMRAFINSFVIVQVGALMEEYGIGTLIQGESSMDENYIRLVYTLSPTYLSQFEADFKEAITSSDTSLKTNSGKNKYIVVSDGDDFYMKKL